MTILLFLCTPFIFTAFAVEAASAVSDCSKSSMDLVLVVDSSTSLRAREFELVKQFLVSVVQSLVISPDHIRLGLVRFSSKVDVIAPLDQSTSTEEALSTIHNMAYKPGGTNTNAALQVTREKVLRAEGGDREGVADVVMVVTDGRSWFPDKTAKEALLLRQRDVEIIVLGIGKNLLMSELKAMTSGVIRLIDSFADLRDVVDDIRAVVCSVANQATEKLHLRATLLSSSPSPSPEPTTAPSPITFTSPTTLPPATTTTTTTRTGMTSRLSSSARTASLSTTSGSFPNISTTQSTTALSSLRLLTTEPTRRRTNVPPPAATGEMTAADSAVTVGGAAVNSTDGESAVMTLPSAELLMTVPPEKYNDCQKQKMDVVFLQDASYSVSLDSFQKAKLFISDIVLQLPIGLDLVRVALVRFGTHADVITNLSQSTDVTAVTSAIQGMEYKTGSTQTGRALRTVREKVLNERRSDARAVVIVITDGDSDRPPETRREAKKLRQERVRLVWLYINADSSDSKAFFRERDSMAGKGDTTFGAASFQALGEEDRLQILNASCQEDPEPATTTSPPASTTIPTTPSITAPASSAADTKTSSGSSSSATIPSGGSDVTEPATSPSGDVKASSPHDAVTSEAASGDPSLGSAGPTSTQDRSTEAGDAATTEQSSHAKFQSSAAGRQSSASDDAEPSTTSSDARTSESKWDPVTRLKSGYASPMHVTTQGPSLSTGEVRGEKSYADEGAGSWVNSLGNVVGVTVGGVALTAVSSACVYYAVCRRRKDKREKKEGGEEP